ncbi:uncharacterized protein LOC126965934 isoform X2 [Leptidea sinapis]|uniref:uncharacterized protein LOC126965934 isoform X2 n=1 Tax=Leptidea sinapis TaxID=189913 RepID=UPI00212BFE86|nr:uncharacterized protein LOC126965934 isoform X2 [Leptidea sinapis]
MFMNRQANMFPPFVCCLRNNYGDDGFAVVSEYFGRGLFNKVTVVTDAPAPRDASDRDALSERDTPSEPAQDKGKTYGPGAEAKLRLQEGQSKQVFGPNKSSVVPVPEGRMRLMERQQYSSSLEANIKSIEPATHIPPCRQPSPRLSPNISSAITNSNPFEDTYDESKNPFADEQNDPTNPFSDDDDYDKNMNPFT